MNKKLFFPVFIIFFFLVMSSSMDCHRPNPSDDNDEWTNDSASYTEPPEGVSPEYLTKYSWKEVKYYYIDGDSLYDFSYLFIGGDCDTQILTFDTSGILRKRFICENFFETAYWKFSNDYKYLAFFTSEDDFKFSELYGVRLLSQDTMKLIYANSEDYELFYKIMIVYTAVPKEGF